MLILNKIRIYRIVQYSVNKTGDNGYTAHPVLYKKTKVQTLVTLSDVGIILSYLAGHKSRMDGDFLNLQYDVLSG
jgi:hypothetical protein